MLLNSITALVQTLPCKVLLLGTIVMDSALAFLAVQVEPSQLALDNRTLIMVALFGNITVLIGVVFTGFVTLKSARISANNAKQLEVVAQLPAKVEEYTTNVDGKMTELMRLSRESEHAKGKEEERQQELMRKGEAALAQKLAPTPVIVENPKDKPAHVKPVE